MKISLIQVPYHLGQERVGMGLGPIHLVQSGIQESLSDQNIEVKVEEVITSRSSDDELEAIASVNNSLGILVKKTIKEGFFPVILGGNCNTCLGTLNGIDLSQTGIIWFDAHGDFNTPERSISGYFDGMSLAVATGQCYKGITKFNPVPESCSLLLGVRDLDPEEKIALDKSEVRIVKNIEIKKTGLKEVLIPALRELQTRIKKVYIHIDLDVLEPKDSPGVDYRSPNGLSADEVVNAINLIGNHFQVIALNIATYNPQQDTDDKTLKICFRLFNAIAEVVK